MRGRWQRSEKVGVAWITTNNRAWKAPKSLCLVADLGLKRASGEFFNTLMNSANFALKPSSLQLRRGFDSDRSLAGSYRTGDEDGRYEEEHPAISLTDEQVSEMVAARSYCLEYLLVDVGGSAFEEHFGPEPY